MGLDVKELITISIDSFRTDNCNLFTGFIMALAQKRQAAVGLSQREVDLRQQDRGQSFSDHDRDHYRHSWTWTITPGGMMSKDKAPDPITGGRYPTMGMP